MGVGFMEPQVSTDHNRNKGKGKESEAAPVMLGNLRSSEVSEMGNTKVKHGRGKRVCVCVCGGGLGKLWHGAS